MARKSEKKTEGSFSDLFFDNGSESLDSASTLRLSEIEPNKTSRERISIKRRYSS